MAEKGQDGQAPNAEHEDLTDDSSSSQWTETVDDMCDRALSSDFGFPHGWTLGYKVHPRPYGCKAEIALHNKLRRKYSWIVEIRCLLDLDLFRETLIAKQELFPRLAENILKHTQEQCSPSTSSSKWFEGDTLEMEEPYDPEDTLSKPEDTHSQQCCQ